MRSCQNKPVNNLKTSFKEWLERLKAVVSCFVEKYQAVEGYRNRDVVYQGNPNVPVFQFQNADLVMAVVIEDNFND